MGMDISLVTKLWTSSVRLWILSKSVKRRQGGRCIGHELMMDRALIPTKLSQQPEFCPLRQRPIPLMRFKLLSPKSPEVLWFSGAGEADWMKL
jgi:hypothetical protein